MAKGGACMVKGGMHGEGGHVWQRGGMCGKGGMRGKGGHAFQRGVCVVKGVCVAKGGVCVAKGGHAWDMTRYGNTINERAVRILLECILV